MPSDHAAPVVQIKQSIRLPKQKATLAKSNTHSSTPQMVAYAAAAHRTSHAAPTTSPKTKFVTVKKGDTLALIFKKNDLSPQQLQKLLATPHGNDLKQIRPGETLEMTIDGNKRLIALRKKLDTTTTLLFAQQKNNQFTSKIQKKNIETRIAYASAEIEDSLFASGKRADLNDTLLMSLASIFTYDIDFALDIQPKDNFEILYEEIYIDGEKMGPGNILAAKFTNQGKVYEAIGFKDPKGQLNYYTPKGKSLKKAFTRTPVQYTRISSHFNPNRKHPILHHIRAHRGVDYAAPRGTPVKAAGKGKIVYIGKNGGYGNHIILQHGRQYSTLYGHLDRFSKNIRTGSSVDQGQVIGYVGKTGLATGPHLHYEFRVNGVHRNPLTVALPTAEDIPKTKKSPYLAHASQMLKLMDYHNKVMVARADI
ncbi:MAG TPA: peptidoglycan DD-metalloendopeptidase family protein [Gammaproteobacteria bacterium]|nr:peptidoglycan DD-metalloendopeptidase family protein [Gammaproteobacteria bacterium]